MPGRTPKSLSHAMEKVRAQGAAYQKQTGQPVTTPKGSRKGATAAPKTPPTSKYLDIDFHLGFAFCHALLLTSYAPIAPTRATRKHPSPRRDDSDEDDDEEYSTCGTSLATHLSFLDSSAVLQVLTCYTQSLALAPSDSVDWSDV